MLTTLHKIGLNLNYLVELLPTRYNILFYNEIRRISGLC